MSSSLHPYKYWKQEEAYYFDTPSGKRYIANFLQYPNLSENLYIFNFDILTSGTANVPDENVFDTICTILQEFFRAHSNAMLVTCDSTDGREAARRRLFNAWYLKLSPSGLAKIDREGKADSYNLFISLFIWEDNPNKDSLIAFLNEFYEDMLL